MVLNDATGGCAGDGMMTRDMTGDATDRGALQAALRVNHRRQHGRARCGNQSKDCFSHF
jgi:hypothetical protein